MMLPPGVSGIAMLPSRMADYAQPAYLLSDIVNQARAGLLHYQLEALDDAGALNFDRHDINDCLIALKSDDFFKSMDAENPAWQGCRQDVYKPTYCGVEV